MTSLRNARQIANLTHRRLLWRAALTVLTPLEQHVGLDRSSVLIADGSVAADKLVAALTQPRDQVTGQHLPFVQFDERALRTDVGELVKQLSARAQRLQLVA